VDVQTDKVHTSHEESPWMSLNQRATAEFSTLCTPSAPHSRDLSIQTTQTSLTMSTVSRCFSSAGTARTPRSYSDSAAVKELIIQTIQSVDINLHCDSCVALLAPN
jgi:hypothetical protein